MIGFAPDCKSNGIVFLSTSLRERKEGLKQQNGVYVTGFERTRLPRTLQEDTLFTITR